MQGVSFISTAGGGRVAGIGLVKVAAATEGAPAARAGVHSGAIITEIDGVPVRGLMLDQTIETMRGPVNVVELVRARNYRTAHSTKADLPRVRS